MTLTLWHCGSNAGYPGCRAQGRRWQEPEAATKALQAHIERVHLPKPQRDWSNHEWDDTDQEIARLLCQQPWLVNKKRSDVAEELGLKPHEVQKRVEAMLDAKVIRDCGWRGTSPGQKTKAMAYGEAWPAHWPNPRKEAEERDSKRLDLKIAVDKAGKAVLDAAAAGRPTEELAKIYRAAVQAFDEFKASLPEEDD